MAWAGGSSSTRPRGVPQHAHRTFDQRQAFGQQVRDGLIGPDRFAVLLADLRVVAGERRARRAQLRPGPPTWRPTRAHAIGRRLRPIPRRLAVGVPAMSAVGPGQVGAAASRHPDQPPAPWCRESSRARWYPRASMARSSMAMVAPALSAPRRRARSSARTGPRNGASTSRRPNSSATIATSTPEAPSERSDRQPVASICLSRRAMRLCVGEILRPRRAQGRRPAWRRRRVVAVVQLSDVHP